MELAVALFLKKKKKFTNLACTKQIARWLFLDLTLPMSTVDHSRAESESGGWQHTGGPHASAVHVVTGSFAFWWQAASNYTASWVTGRCTRSSLISFLHRSASFWRKSGWGRLAFIPESCKAGFCDNSAQSVPSVCEGKEKGREEG